jgi:hypothetical protein
VLPHCPEPRPTPPFLKATPLHRPILLCPSPSRHRSARPASVATPSLRPTADRAPNASSSWCHRFLSVEQGSGAAPSTPCSPERRGAAACDRCRHAGSAPRRPIPWVVRVHGINMLLTMHHIALCTPCIELFNCCPSFAHTGRSRGAENGDPKGTSLRSVRRSISVKR